MAADIPGGTADAVVVRPTVDRRSRDTREGYSVDHVLHELFITEFLLAVWQTTRGRSDLELLTMQRRSLAKHPAFAIRLESRATWLQPDAMFLFRQTGGGMVCCFVEMDTGKMNLKQIDEKYRRYAAWGHMEAGQTYLIDLYRRHGATDPRPNFRVLFVADDRTGTGGHSRMRELYSTALKQSGSARDRLWFTSVGQLRDHQWEALPLGSAIWRRGRDCKLGPQPAFTSNRQHRRTSERSCRETALVDLPLHPLFPFPAVRAFALPEMHANATGQAS